MNIYASDIPVHETRASTLIPVSLQGTFLMLPKQRRSPKNLLTLSFLEEIGIEPI